MNIKAVPDPRTRAVAVDVVQIWTRLCFRSGVG